MEGTNKYNTSQPLTLQTLTNYKSIQIGKVVVIDDPSSLDRIKVRINGLPSKGGDAGVAINDLAWCIPLVPKFFTSKPKLGESVYILTLSNEDKHSDRLYFGPIISQPQFLNYDPNNTSSLAAFSFGTTEPNVAISRIPELKGIFPNDEDISIQGRYNASLILKKNESLLRVGMFVESQPTKTNPYYFTYNTKTQAYLQMKNNVVFTKATSNTPEVRGSTTNVISNKINLLTYPGGSPSFNILNQDNLISDDEIIKIIANAHPMVFGDILIQYLKAFKNAFLNHFHNNGRPTDLKDGNNNYVAAFTKAADDLEKTMLSKNIRIN